MSKLLELAVGGDGSTALNCITVLTSSMGAANLVMDAYISSKHGLKDTDWVDGLSFSIKPNQMSDCIRARQVRLIKDNSEYTYYFDLARPMRGVADVAAILARTREPGIKPSIPRGKMPVSLQALPVDLVVPAVISFILCALAPLDSWPYGYYQVLRIIVSLSAAWFGFNFWPIHYLRFSFIVITLLFNPFVPIHLNRATWAILDTIAGAIFVLALYERWSRAKRQKL